MRYKADLLKGELLVNGARFNITCEVRSLQNGKRRSDEVVRTMPGGYPYDPRPFPLGVWRITGVEWQTKDGKAMFDHKTYGPVKIRTDAKQWVKIWELDKDGDYLRERGDEVQDHGYLLHYSASKTTWGCIRIETPEHAALIGKITQAFLEKKEIVEIEITWGNDE